MIGYYEVPLYTDTTYSTVRVRVGVPIISRTAFEELCQRTLDYVGVQDQQYNGVFYSGEDFDKKRILYGDAGVHNAGGSLSITYSNYLPKNPLLASQLKLTLRDAFSKVFCHTPVAGDLTLDKFNFASLATLAYNEQGTETVYCKNGNYIVVTREEDDYYVYGKISLRRSNGGEISNGKYALAVKQKSGNSMSINMYTLISVGGVEGIIETFGINSGSWYAGHCHMNYLFDDMSYINSYDIYALDTSVHLFRVTDDSPKYMRDNYPNGWYTGIGFGSWGKRLDKFFTQFLGFSISKTNDENFKNVDGEFFEHNDDPDGENTYPGGGNDQNQYPEDGTSGKGTFDNRNDPIDFPDMPIWDATSTGFISLWNPTITEITELYGFLWDSDISTTLKKLFLEPMDAIISLAFFPVEPTLFPGGKRGVTIGHVDTGITMNAVQKQFVDFDFGEIGVDEYYGAAWDYSPYTHASIYLPYIGVQAIDVDDVMKGTLHLKYRIDLLSGMCSAMLKVDRSRDGLGAIIYTWQGNCAMFVPVTAGSAREFINSIIQIGAMAGVSLAQPAAGAIENRANRDVEGYKAPSLGGNWINPAMSAYSTLNVLGQKVHVQRGGRVDSNAGVMSPQQAYVILTRPVSAIPKGWNKYAGYPSLKIKKLSTQKGYTEIAYIKLNNLEATAEEISELNSILRGGVIL